MVLIRVCQCTPAESAPSGGWTAQVRSDKGVEEQVKVNNPFTPAQEKDVYWYMEDHVNNPFDVTKAAEVHAQLRNYAKELACFISLASFFPNRGDLELEIEGIGTQSLLILHWELLEDPSVWPTRFKFSSITIKRIVGNGLSGSDVALGLTTNKVLNPDTKFNILLVICRPKHRENSAIEYQLVSRRLVKIIDQIRADAETKVHLTILRPPTFEDFTKHLTEDVVAGYYQLVHFDMHGTVKKSDKSGKVEASLRFSRYVEGQAVYETKGRLKSAVDIAAVLLKAKVSCVIANACDSASVAHDSATGNFAQLLVQSGISFVLAMSYQIIDNAVEIFMETFYRSLLLQGRDASQSAHDGRIALLNSPERTARFLQRITLADYFVPVSYHDGRAPPLRVIQTQLRKPKSSSRLSSIFHFPGHGSDRLDENAAYRNVMSHNRSKSDQRSSSRLSLSRAKAMLFKRAIADDVEEEIVGRDHNVLEMEHILKKSGKLLLYGQGSCGKSALLQYCKTWWIKSNLIGDAYYFDFATLLDKNGTCEDLIAGISKLLSPSEAMLSEDDIVNILRNPPAPMALIFDSMETLDCPGFWQTAKFPKSEQVRLWTFLEKACRGNTYLIFASRVASGPVAQSIPGMIPYCLDGLSVSACALLAEKVIKAKSPSDAAKLGTRQGVDYLRRIFILLECNPEAIMAVLPNLWKGELSTMQLFHNLLGAVCPLDEEISRNSRFLRTIRSVNAQQEFFSAFGTGYITPWHLFPFWNIVPYRLDEYFYFMYWRMGGLQGRFARERQYSYSLTINIEVDAFEVNHKFRTNETLERIFESLEKAGIAHPVKATFKEEKELEEEEDDRLHAEDRCLWHVHPLFTLCSRAMAGNDILQAGTYAFVRHQTIWGKKSMRHSYPKFQELVWDNEVQHSDHFWNNHVAALIISLRGDILQETRIHGPSMTDVLLLAVEEGFHHNRRLNEVVKPIARQHIDRLLTLPTLRGDGIFSLYEKDALMTNIYRFVKDDPADSAGLLDGAVIMCGSWRSMSQDSETGWLPSLEQSWLELCLTRCRLTMTESRIKAKGELEEVLQTDPLFQPSDPLYDQIRRMFAQLLMAWFECAAYQMSHQNGMDETTMMRTGARILAEIAKGSKTGSMFESFFDNPNIKDSDWNMSIRNSFVQITQQFSTDVEKFGTLVQAILDEPLWKVYAYHRDGTLEEYIAAMKRPGEINKTRAGAAEFVFRSLAGEQASAQQLLHDAIASQTTSASADPRELLGMLEMSYFDAKEQGEWLKTLKILDEMERLGRDFPTKPGDRARRHITYAASLDELGRGAECARRMIKASEILLTCLDDEHANTLLLQGAGCFKSLCTASTNDQLNFAERRKLRDILRQADEYKAGAEERQKVMDDLSETMKQARMILGLDAGI